MCDCKWRDISSAPKDGTFIMVYAPPLKIRFYPLVVWWDGDDWYAPAHEDHAQITPTHWMPLPSPPAALPETPR
jgi:hypothetical protein